MNKEDYYKIYPPVLPLLERFPDLIDLVKPIEAILEENGIEVGPIDFPSIMGLCVKKGTRSFIGYKEGVASHIKEEILLHELTHLVLHKENTLCLIGDIVSKLEVEAWKVTAVILIPKKYKFESTKDEDFYIENYLTSEEGAARSPMLINIRNSMSL
ncbi:ImmA/IrrE family metallo-endopeptidase [Thermodesulfobium sp.]